VGPLIVEAFRYNRWANLHLLDVCAGLNDEQLAWTAPGTYGTIGATFQHLLSAEQRYLWRLVGREASLNEDQPFPGIAELRRHAESSGDALIEAAASVAHDQDEVYLFRNQRVRMRPGVIVLQAMHHGNDHRAHVCTILGAHNVEYGEMDVWAYGYANAYAKDVDEAAC